MPRTFLEKQLQVITALAPRVFSFIRARLWMILIGVVVLGFIVYSIVSKTEQTKEVETVATHDLVRTVLATGTVTSTTDIDFGFGAKGTVAMVKKVGDSVSAGDVIASLEQSQAQANMLDAQATLLKANAAYQQVSVSLQGTKDSEDTKVAAAYRTLLSSGLSAVPNDLSNDDIPPVITGAYTGTTEGVYKITTYQSSTRSGYSLSYSGIETGSGVPVQVENPVALGTLGLYIRFPQVVTGSRTWIIEIPNKRGSEYAANLNAYLAAVDNRATALRNATALLEGSGGESIDASIAHADVLSAQAKVTQAKSALADTELRTPVAGTITRLDVKVGEEVEAGKSVATVEDLSHLYVESLVNEAAIHDVVVGQPATITFDALGKDTVFTGSVFSIEPSGTVTGGIVNYKVKISLAPDPRIRPDMTATLLITTFSKKDTLAIPERFIVRDGAATYVLRVKNTDASDTPERVAVTLGQKADGGMIEVLSGISVGDILVTQ